MKLFTIGHSNYELETFIYLLKKHEVNAVADVRSHPYSRFLPHFNRLELKRELAKDNIAYVFLGRELGARSTNPDCYVDGRAIYEKIAESNEFQNGVQRVLKVLLKHNISLMCAEKDPLTCHRAILVCQYMRHIDMSINHILKGAELESHSHLEERLLAKHGFDEFLNNRGEKKQLSLFEKPIYTLSTKEESLKKAYKLQGYDIAYVERNNNGRANKSIHDRVHTEECSKVLREP